jgi:hypothetical protein
MQRITASFVFAATGTTATATIHENGYLTDYILVAPNFTNSVTSTLSIADDSTSPVTIWTGDAKNENATSVVNSLSVPVDRGFTITCTISGVAGGTGGTVTTHLFIQTAK